MFNKQRLSCQYHGTVIHYTAAHESCWHHLFAGHESEMYVKLRPGLLLHAKQTVITHVDMES